MLTNVLEGAELERQLAISIREFLRLAYLSVQKLNEHGFDPSRLRNQPHLRVQLDEIRKTVAGE